MKKIIVLALLFIIGCSSGGVSNSITGSAAGDLHMFKSPTCGCCVGHKAMLEKNGYSVAVEQQTDLNPIKQKHKIPRNMQSCHTIEKDGYFIEGHMPLEAIERLLEERPDIDGIALPGMPSGSAGMPGVKRGPWTIYAITDGVATPWMTV